MFGQDGMTRSILALAAVAVLAAWAPQPAVAQGQARDHGEQHYAHGSWGWRGTAAGSPRKRPPTRP
jgi:hypothetical protein